MGAGVGALGGVARALTRPKPDADTSRLSMALQDGGIAGLIGALGGGVVGSVVPDKKAEADARVPYEVVKMAFIEGRKMADERRSKLSS